jgi:hypothetical protein
MEGMEISDATNDQYIQLNAVFHETLRKGCPWPRVQKMVETLGISLIALNLLVNYCPEMQRENRLIEVILRNFELTWKIIFCLQKII